MNEKLEMAKNSLYNANEIKDIKENPVVESVLLAPIKAIPVLGDLMNNPVPVSLLSGDRKPQIRFLGNHPSGSGNLYHKSFRM